MKTTRPLKFYQAIPKIDLHRHLEGSLRLSTLRDIGRTHNFDIKGTDYLRPLVQVQEDEPYTFENFLSKFTTLREFYRSPEVIARITAEAIEDAALDNVRYLELRFTPVALSRAEEFPLGEVMDWVIHAVHEAEKVNGVITRLIASVNRHESLELAEEVIALSVDRRDKGIVGIDLAGSEANFPATPFISLFKEARQAGLHTTIHAGEWGGPQNVREAIEDFQAERIGHGVRVMEDSAVVDLARQRGAVFEVCITSNYQSPAFWIGAACEFVLVYLTIKLSRIWGILRYLFIAIALLLPGALDNALDIPRELRPNIAFGVYLLAIVWLAQTRNKQ